MLFLRRQLLRTLSFAFGSSFILGQNQLAIAAQTAVQPKVSPPSAGAAVRDGIAGGTEMEKVTGIGGFFFRAKDPKALALWYQQHLGILTIPTSSGATKWRPSYKLRESRSRLTRSPIPTAGSPACMTLRGIRSNCGSLRFQTQEARLQSSH